MPRLLNFSPTKEKKQDIFIRYDTIMVLPVQLNIRWVKMSGQVFRGDRESLSPTMDSYEYSGVTREDLQERYTNPNFANFLSFLESQLFTAP